MADGHMGIAVGSLWLLRGWVRFDCRTADGFGSISHVTSLGLGLAEDQGETLLFLGQFPLVPGTLYNIFLSPRGGLCYRLSAPEDDTQMQLLWEPVRG